MVVVLTGGRIRRTQPAHALIAADLIPIAQLKVVRDHRHEPSLAAHHALHPEVCRLRSHELSLWIRRPDSPDTVTVALRVPAVELVEMNAYRNGMTGSFPMSYTRILICYNISVLVV